VKSYGTLERRADLTQLHHLQSGWMISTTCETARLRRINLIGSSTERGRPRFICGSIRNGCARSRSWRGADLSKRLPCITAGAARRNGTVVAAMRAGRAVSFRRSHKFATIDERAFATRTRTATCRVSPPDESAPVKMKSNETFLPEKIRTWMYGRDQASRLPLLSTRGPRGDCPRFAALLRD